MDEALNAISSPDGLLGLFGLTLWFLMVGVAICAFVNDLTHPEKGDKS